jgi:hypothetical protein
MVNVKGLLTRSSSQSRLTLAFVVLVLAGLTQVTRFLSAPYRPRPAITTERNDVVKRHEDTDTVLSSRGVAQEVPFFDNIVAFGKLRVAIADPNVNGIPRADGDEAIQYIVGTVVDIATRCREDPTLHVLDVGGLYGDFGLSAAASGCRTVIFEPQPSFAKQIARSVLLNGLELKAGVHNTAVSPLPCLVSRHSADAGQAYFDAHQGQQEQGQH